MRYPGVLAVLMLLPGAALAQERSPAAACAAEARFITPDDPIGKALDQLDPAVAIPLCEAALAADPNDQASRANLARALLKAERIAEALALAKIAAEAGNPQALRMLAIQHETGGGVPVDLPLAFRLITQAADAGYVPAMTTLAQYLEEGTGTAKDEKSAISRYRRAMSRGDPVAAIRLGVMIEEGRGAPADPVEANRLYRIAADAGRPEAMRYLAINHLNGIGFQKSFDQAVIWFRKAIEAGDVESHSELGLAYEQAEGEDYDIKQAVRWYRLGSEAGDHRSTAFLGVNYAQGLGVPEDDAEAVRLYRRAAEGGDAFAMRSLALAYLNGEGVERDYQQHHEWLARAIEAGDTTSLRLLGQAYENGEGVARDDAEAVKLYRRAHEAGDISGTVELGRMTFQGRGGLAQDYAAGLKLLRAAAAAGSALAMRHIASAYFTGDGVPADEEQARSWERRAAETGDSAAAFSLGRRLFEGAGPNRVDIGEARKWLKRAADLGHDEAEEMLVRATLADPDLPDRGAAAVRLLNAAASIGRGWAIAALAHPGPPVAPAAGTVDRGAWQSRLAALEGSALLAASAALKSGQLAEQRLDLAFELSRRAGGADALAAKEHEIALLLDLKLYGAAVGRYEAFVESDAFKAAPAGRRETFEHKFAAQLANMPSSAFSSSDALFSLAERGVAAAAYELGVYYRSEANSEQDSSQARYWYERAVELGSRDALLSLGYLYSEGLGGEQNEQKAVDLFRRAADAGSAVAKRNLGFMYRDGRGVPRDLAQAYTWFSRAAAEADLVANTSVALARFRGEGTPVDPAGALEALQKGVDCLDPPAIYHMAQAFFEGAGVVRSPEAGWRWMKFAASQQADSIGTLGMAQAAALGWGGAPDLALAREWLAKARLLGNEVAAKALEQCGEQASLDCLRKVEDFVPEPLMKQPRSVAPPPLDAAAEEAQAKARFADAVDTNKSFVEILTAFGALDRHYRITGNADGLIGAHLEWVMLEEARLERIYSTRDNYFALFDSSCRWGIASRAASAMDRDEAAVLFAKIAVNRLQEARRRIADLDADVRECFIEAHRDRYRELTARFLELGRFEEAENVLAMLKDFEFQAYGGGAGDRGRSIDPMPMTPGQIEVMRLYEATYRSFAARRRSRGAERGLADAEHEGALRRLVAELNKLESQSQRQLVADPLRPPRVQAVLDALPHGKVAALQAVVQPDRVYWLLSTPAEQKVVAFAIKLPELAQLIRAYRDALANAQPNAQALGAELYKLVFAPVDAELKAAGAQQVLLSLDDMLRYVPFAALHDGQGWLVERYAFGMFRDTADLQPAGRSASGWRVAGFGATRASEGLEALPLVADELRGIVRSDQAQTGLLPGRIHLDNSFDRQSLVSALKEQYDAIHIASHFVLDSKSRDASYLLLGTGERLSLEAFRTDAALKFGDADFLALSACETGLSAKDASGIEIDSMAEIAQDAGAPAVLASLWRVADSSTSRLMISFYRSRTQGDAATKAQALRQAQLDLIARGARGEGPVVEGVPPDQVVKFDHPFYWAPFILLGDSM